jgi:uncharacterized protein YbbC (DUF1343 family)
VTAVATGLDRVIAGEVSALRGKRVGLIAHPASVDRRLRHAIDGLRGAGVDLVRLFGPEHGLRGTAQDMIAVAERTDARTGLPVVGLYGATFDTLSPRPADLEGLDALAFDLQDVGARYYTYVWTLVLAMRACAEAGVAVVVLDRPNPLGGEVIEGPPIEPGFESFVGLADVPNRHGLTAGELARLMAARERLDVELEIVTMDGWRRSMWFDETGLPWVLPSPNMPTLDTAIVYPGMCMLEGTELSEGRGTTRPFELAGAPGLDGFALAERLAATELIDGAVFRPVTFEPTFQKHARTPCGGVQIHVVDRDRYPSTRAGVAFVAAVRSLLGDRFQWRTRAYEFVDAICAFDLLAGSAAIRAGIEAGASVDELCDSWVDNQAAFAAERAPFLLYS